MRHGCDKYFYDEINIDKVVNAIERQVKNE